MPISIWLKLLRFEIGPTRNVRKIGKAGAKPIPVWRGSNNDTAWYEELGSLFEYSLGMCDVLKNFAQHYATDGRRRKGERLKRTSDPPDCRRMVLLPGVR